MFFRLFLNQLLILSLRPGTKWSTDHHRPTNQGFGDSRFVGFTMYLEVAYNLESLESNPQPFGCKTNTQPPDLMAYFWCLSRDIILQQKTTPHQFTTYNIDSTSAGYLFSIHANPQQH